MEGFGGNDTDHRLAPYRPQVGVWERPELSVGISLECGGLTPLWPRLGVIYTKAASSRRTLRRRPISQRLTSGRVR